MSTIRIPNDDGCNGWYNLLETPPPARRLNADVQVDWLVIGAGVTGLAAARRLGQLRPNERVAILEALRVGQGASGRNSGFIIDVPHERDLEGDDPIRKQKILSLNQTAISDLADLVERFGIACDWSAAGKYQGAIGARGISYLQRLKTLLDALEYPYTCLNREELVPRLGTRAYAAAIHTENTILMQPAALIRGLGRTLPDNVKLFEETPVIKQRRDDGYWRAVTPGGEVRAKNLLLATNIYAPEFGTLRYRILPVMTYASMTRALTGDEIERFQGVPRPFGLTPADDAGTTLRLTSDGRLLIRNQYRFVPRYQDDMSKRDDIRANHRTLLARRYPELAHVPFIDTWGGATGLSRNSESFFGAVGDRVWAAGVYQGVGVARGTMSGKLLAELAAGEDSEQVADMQAVSGKPGLNPPAPFLGWGVKAMMRYAEWASRSEL